MMRGPLASENRQTGGTLTPGIHDVPPNNPLLATKEKIESILRLRCPEHDKTPLLVEDLGGKLSIETCCDAFEKQVKEALAR